MNLFILYAVEQSIVQPSSSSIVVSDVQSKFSRSPRKRISSSVFRPAYRTLKNYFYYYPDFHTSKKKKKYRVHFLFGGVIEFV